jgi:signal transduction protein with GAF and PtsI domain
VLTKLRSGGARPGRSQRFAEPNVGGVTTIPNWCFRQILKTEHMGSAVFAPIVWQPEAFGVLTVAAQARNTYDGTDLEVALLFANAAAAGLDRFA